MSCHVEDVHFYFSVSDLDPGFTRTHTLVNVPLSVNTDREVHTGQGVNSLGDAIVDSNRGQIFGNKPLLTVTFDDATLWTKNCLIITIK